MRGAITRLSDVKLATIGIPEEISTTQTDSMEDDS
jgi:hypothetical protein